MATFQMPIFGRFQPDTSGDIYPSFLDVELTLGSLSPGHIDCIVMEDPTGSDIGGECAFTVPQNYAGSPVLVIRGILDSTADVTLAFGAQQIAVAHDETADVAYEAEDLGSANVNAIAAEDMYEETITLTPASAYQAGDMIFLYLFRDNDVDDSTINFLLTDLLFQYSDV